MDILAPTPIIGPHIWGNTNVVDLVFARLGAYLDEEADRLLRLARLLQMREVPRLLAALGCLHRGPGHPDTEALSTAVALLGELPDAVQAIPCEPVPTGPVESGDESFVRDIDAAVRWSGARLEDQHRAVMHLSA